MPALVEDGSATLACGMLTADAAGTMAGTGREAAEGVCAGVEDGFGNEIGRLVGASSFIKAIEAVSGGFPGRLLRDNVGMLAGVAVGCGMAKRTT